jgi:hypothetical protein
MKPSSDIQAPVLARHDAVGSGSPPASGAGAGALAHRLVFAVGPEPTGEGAGRHTRGRVCSPLWVASFRLSLLFALTPATILLPAEDPPAPARVDGTWKWSFTMPDGSKLEPRVKLKQEGDQLTGTARFRPDNDMAITNGTFQGEEVRFQVVRERDGQAVTTTYRGRVKGGGLKGTIESNWAGEMKSYPWEATRASADVTGTWEWTMAFREWKTKMTLQLKQEGEKLTGKLRADTRRPSDIKDGKFKKGEVSFTVERERDGVKSFAKYTGKIEGDTIKGSLESDMGGVPRSFLWEANRVSDEH